MPSGVIVWPHSLIMTLPGDVLFESSHEKTCRRDLRPVKTQTRLLS